MSLLQKLEAETRTARRFLLEAPAIRRALAGDVTRGLYLAFLGQAFHRAAHGAAADGGRQPAR